MMYLVWFVCGALVFIAATWLLCLILLSPFLIGEWLRMTEGSANHDRCSECGNAPCTYPFGHPPESFRHVKLKGK